MNGQDPIKFHFLLPFGDEASLRLLNDAGRYDLLQKVLASGPSDGSWRALLELFASWPDSNARADAYALVNREIGGWSDHLRTLYSSWGFIYEGGKLSSLAKIAKTIVIVSREQAGDKELTTVLGSPEMRSIRTLVIRGEVHVRGLTALTDSPFLTNLSTLALEGVALSDEKFRILFGADKLPSLQALRLKDTGMRAERTGLLMQSALIVPVSRLDLSFNTLDDEAALILAASTKTDDLQFLNLQGNFIGDRGASALAAAMAAGPGKELDVSGNALTEKGRAGINALLQRSGIRVSF